MKKSRFKGNTLIGGKLNNIGVNKDLFLIYGASSCPNCEAVKKLLNSKDMQFVYKSFGQDYELQELTDLGVTSRSIPQVFVMSEGNILNHVGGLMETVKYLKDV